MGEPPSGHRTHANDENPREMKGHEPKVFNIQEYLLLQYTTESDYITLTKIMKLVLMRWHLIHWKCDHFNYMLVKENERVEAIIFYVGLYLCPAKLYCFIWYHSFAMLSNTNVLRGLDIYITFVVWQSCTRFLLNYIVHQRIMKHVLSDLIITALCICLCNKPALNH